MSLLDNMDFIEINMYYKYIKAKGGKKLIIVEDDKAEEDLKDPEKAKEIDVLETKWTMLTWKEQNEVTKVATYVSNTETGAKDFDHIKYRDAVVKRCLKSWNLTLNGGPVEVSPNSIDKMPSSVILVLFDKFNDYIEFSEDEIKN